MLCQIHVAHTGRPHDAVPVARFNFHTDSFRARFRLHPPGSTPSFEGPDVHAGDRRTGARILIDVGDGSSFPSAAHLAAYAGLAPATRSSGSSIRGEQPSRRGNKQLKRAFSLSAFVALADPVSRAYYGQKIAQGKHHAQAIRCLARCRAGVLFAMLRDGTSCQPRAATTAS
ncbi:hypothetical protein GCM10010319_23810 [Streptomyces blastmyceticus]|uniref:Transposase IS116/IS110/IS902 C-terminal domain-containing protein n=1 Tax=Streptomyces blastmyceticus TaxID=68180 RepID=A0ABN0WTU4_9ACTN